MGLSLGARLLAEERLYTAWSGYPEPLIVDLLARQGFDAVTLDMQHGAHTEGSVLRGIPMILGQGKHAIVRIPVGRFDMASRAVDFGAEAVIAPMINSVADAKAFAASMKYPPVGERSWGPTFAMQRQGGGTAQDWLTGTNARTFAIAMVETRAAYAVLDDILAVPGIDGIFVGPSDFSIAWTDGAVYDPAHEDMMQAVASIAERTRAAGKFACMFVNFPDGTGRFVGMGYRLFAVGQEPGIIALGSDMLLKAAKASAG